MNRLVIIVISLFVLTIAGFFGLKPIFEDWRDLENQIIEKSNELKNQKGYFSDLEIASSRMVDFKDSFSKIDSSIPVKNSIPSLYAFVQETSAQSGLILKSISSTSIISSRQVEGLNETQLSLSVLGSYTSFKDFLSILEKSARFIKIENMSLYSPGEDTSSFSFTLGIRTYSY